MYSKFFDRSLLLVLLFVGFSHLSFPLMAQCNFNAPWSEDFTSNFIPNCWTQSATIGGPWVFNPSATPDLGGPTDIPDHTTNGTVRNYTWVDNSGADIGVILTSPRTYVGSLTNPTLELFLISHDFYYAVQTFNLIYIETWNGSSFSTIDTIQGDFGPRWKQFLIDLGPHTYSSGDSIWVQFRMESGQDPWDNNDVLIDDVSIIDYPTCSKPDYLESFKARPTGGSGKWRSLGPGNFFECQIGPSGFALGSGTTVSITDTFVDFTGLLPLTSYDWYVREVCGGGNYSEWSGPASFTTECQSYATPFFQTFDFSTIPQCWKTYGGEDWRFGSTWAPNITDHTYGNNTLSKFTGVDGGGTSYDDVTLESPFIDLSNLSAPVLRFFMFTNNTANPQNRADTHLEISDGGTWKREMTMSGNHPDWEEVLFDLQKYSGVIRFRLVVDHTLIPSQPWEHDIAIDDVSIVEASDCLPPLRPKVSFLASDSVQLSWVASNGPGNNFEIEFGPRDFARGTGTSYVVTDTFLSISGLNPNTDYDWYLREICGPTDSTIWPFPNHFTTFDCQASPVPFNETFDIPIAPACWTLEGSFPWQFNTSWPSGGAQGLIEHTYGNNALSSFAGFNGGLGKADDVGLITPPIDLSLWATPELRFFIFSNNIDLPVDKAKLHIDVFDGNNWNTEHTYQNNSFVWEEVIVSLAAYSGYIRIRFRADNSHMIRSGHDNDIIIDDVSVEGYPASSFSWSQTMGNTIQFNSSIFPVPDSVLWNFGDGAMSNLPNPVHTYSSPGSKTVCLSFWIGGQSQTFCQTIVISSLENDIRNLSRLYPNPSYRILNVEIPNTRIEELRLFDLSGKILGTFTGSKEDTQKINIDFLESGLYLLKINTEKGEHFFRFQKITN